jgi:hypothetical protein
MIIKYLKILRCFRQLLQIINQFSFKLLNGRERDDPSVLQKWSEEPLSDLYNIFQKQILSFGLDTYKKFASF